MKIVGFFLLAFFFITAKGQNIFQKTFGTVNYEEIWGMDITSDNGFILAGYTNIDNGYILKLNSNGDTIWTKNIDAGGMDLFYSIQQTKDNGFIVGGRTNGFGAGGQDMFLIKTDANGNNQWTKAIGGSGDETINSVKETFDGGFIIAGNTYSFGAGLNDFYIVKSNSSGNILWSKSIGGTGNDNAYSITQTIDSGYVAVGFTTSAGAGDKDVLCVKLDKNGNIVWEKTYGGTGDDRANSIRQTIDGGFIISGVTNSFGAGNYDFYLIKIDLSGNLSWEKTFGGAGDEWAYSIEQTKDNGFILAGYTTSFGAGSADYYIVKTNSVGDTIWTKTFGGTLAEYGTVVKQTPDNGYAIIGYGQSFGAGSSDFYFVKTDSNGNGICNQNNTNTLINNPTSIVTTSSLTVSSGGVDNSISSIITRGITINSLCTNVSIPLFELRNSQTIVLYQNEPNPFAESTIIRYFIPDNINKAAFIVFYDSYGKEIKKIEIKETGFGNINIDAQNLTNGIYSYSLVIDDIIKETKKMIKQ